MPTTIETMSSVTRAAEFMVGVLIMIFILFLLSIFMYLYAKRYPGAIPLFGRRLTFPSAETTSSVDAMVPPCGLDPKAIKSLPFIVFKPEDFDNKGIDCAVCLSEVSTGETVRILPKCNHGFHLDCIDMWLFSHCTCPLCRCPVAHDLAPPKPLDYASMVDGTETAESVPNFPTNVLFWGSQDEISSGVAPQLPRPGEIAVWEISGLPEENSGLSSTASAPPPVIDETKLPNSTRIRSLSRLLVRGSRGIMIGNSCHPRVGGDDIELGFRAPATAESSNPIAPTSS